MLYIIYINCMCAVECSLCCFLFAFCCCSSMLQVSLLAVNQELWNKLLFLFHSKTMNTFQKGFRLNTFLQCYMWLSSYLASVIQSNTWFWAKSRQVPDQGNGWTSMVSSSEWELWKTGTRMLKLLRRYQVAEVKPFYILYYFTSIWN